MLEVLLVLSVVAAVAWVVTRPLRHQDDAIGGESAERAELEARKEAKYREIRDAELDHRMGKLTDEDWRATDRVLRAEALELLRRLDEHSG